MISATQLLSYQYLYFCTSKASKVRTDIDEGRELAVFSLLLEVAHDGMDARRLACAWHS